MTDYFSYTLDADAIRAISSIGLAHLGDAVYELLVRTYLCAHGKATGKGLHRATVELVRAPKQAELADAIFGELTDEEKWSAALAMTSALPQRLFTADYERMVEEEETPSVKA